MINETIKSKLVILGFEAKFNNTYFIKDMNRHSIAVDFATSMPNTIRIWRTWDEDIFIDEEKLILYLVTEDYKTPNDINDKYN